MKGQLAAVIAAATVAFGCSVINAFDDVVPATDASTGGGGGGSGGASGGSGGDSGSGGTGGGGGSTGGSSGTDGGEPPPDGLIVLSARTQRSPGLFDHHLYILDPWTGKELLHEELTQPITAIGYDALRDRWFIFSRATTGIAVDPGVLRTVKFDKATKTFTEESEATVPAADGQGLLGVLNARILYRSVTAPNNPGFTLLDTNDSANVKVLGQAQTPLPAEGAIGAIVRANSASAGGSMNLVQQLTTCQPDPNWDPDAGPAPSLCPIKLLTARIDAGRTDPVLEAASSALGSVPSVGGTVAWTTDGTNDILIFPPKDHTTDANGKVAFFSPFGQHAEIPSSAIPFAAGGPRISSADFDPCREIILATELLTRRAIFAIPTKAGGTPVAENLATSAQRVVYEPYTKSVIRPFDDASNPEISAYLLEGTDLAPSFAKRSAGGTMPWEPPTGILPGAVVVKKPATPVCD
jgi:hypothetical protein